MCSFLLTKTNLPLGLAFQLRSNYYESSRLKKVHSWNPRQVPFGVIQYFLGREGAGWPPAEAVASIANRQRGRKFKFLEGDDDNRLASFAKEKSGFGLDRRASNLAGVADLTSRPHLLHFLLHFGSAAAFQ
jgi:hypothetical protein